MAQRIVPMIAYEDAATAIDWLSEAFGFRERDGVRFTDEHGTVTHAELERDGAIVMLATPNADYQGPKRHRETCEAARRWQDNPWVIDGLFVAVDDVDAHYERAVAAGARVIRPLEDAEGIGLRRYTAEDPEGHRWMFGQHLDPAAA
jgi:PhnB protein